MKKLTLTVFLILNLVASTMANDNFKTTTQKDSNGFSYTTTTNDPLNARIYTLDNGLKVYLTVYKNSPRVQTFVAVKAGSKMDPFNATGLAHYLEHIMFKGTSKIGTSDWEKESIMLDEIEALYQTYRQTTDEKERENIYRKIDSVSFEAAKYAIANEYDKLVSSIGATGTNAYTSFEQTVYINDIPANSIEKWAIIESERFSEIIPRLFHTELEAVYEEKNMGLDSDRRKVWEALLEAEFPKSQYGTQTTIGTVEHLKNPSITEIKKYFDKYYVPNNVAICLSGDLDPEATIQTINKYFGAWKPKEVPAFEVIKEDPIAAPKEVKVLGPDAENIMVSFRFPGIKTEDALKMELVSMILANSQAGLIDLNLNQQQKVLGAYSYSLPLKDYSLHILAASPKEGQSLDEVRDLLLSQLELIKQGEFPDWLLEAIINDYKVSQLKEYESNRARANAFVSAFVYDIPWELYCAKIDLLKTISKEDIVAFVNANYKDNYVVVKKEVGEDTSVVKVPKPAITPVEVNRNAHSPFFAEVQALTTEPIHPVFLNFDEDITKNKLESGVKVFSTKNEENDLFQLYYIFDFGKDDDLELALAIDYLNYIGSKKYSAAELQQEFYKLGCTFSVQSNADKMYVQLSGLQENFGPALKLLEEFIATAKADQDSYDALVDRILKSRADAKLSKDAILKRGMVSYVKYGETSSFTHKLDESALKAIKPKTLTKKIAEMFKYRHRVYFYGPITNHHLVSELNDLHRTSKKGLVEHEKKEFAQQAIDSNHVYFCEYDMVQSEIILLSKSVEYDVELLAIASLYNEYFGGNMGSIVFQELRESKALAYSTRSYYQMAKEKDRANYNVSYIGTQGDKTFMAINGMNALLDSIPYSEAAFVNAKTSMMQKLESQRTLKASILFQYDRALKLGLDFDTRKLVYEKLGSLTFEDIKAFHEAYIKGKPKAYLIIGSKDNLDTKQLEQYGKVTTLSLEEVFGY